MKDAWRYSAVTGGIALACGLALVALRGSLTLPLLLAGAFFVVAYTWPLKYIGLGEVAVIVVWGPLMIGGGYYVITGEWDWNVVLGSLPYALGTTMVIFGKHIDKREADAARHIYTLPVILGDRLARAVAIGPGLGRDAATGPAVDGDYVDAAVLRCPQCRADARHADADDKDVAGRVPLLGIGVVHHQRGFDARRGCGQVIEKAMVRLHAVSSPRPVLTRLLQGRAISRICHGTPG